MLFHELGDQGIQVLTLIVAFVIPTLVALLTKARTSSAFKAVLMVVLNIALTVLSTILDDGGTTFWAAVMLLAEQIMISVVSYVGILKPTKLAGPESLAARAFTKAA